MGFVDVLPAPRVPFRQTEGEERQWLLQSNVTVLFTDIVGSTELSSSLAPEVANEVRRTHFATLREVIAATGGTEVKNLGDGSMVAFDATIPAVTCGVAMQEASSATTGRHQSAWSFGIGISAGDVTVEDFGLLR